MNFKEQFDYIKNHIDLEKYILSENADYSYIVNSMNQHIMKIDVVGHYLGLTNAAIIALEKHPLFPKSIQHKNKRYYFSEEFLDFFHQYGQAFADSLKKDWRDKTISQKRQRRLVLPYFEVFIRAHQL